VAYAPACTLKASHKGRNFRDKTTVPLVRQEARRPGDGGHNRRGIARDALIAATSAQASTNDCVNWASPKPPGVYCFGIDGSGRQVSGTYGNYYFVGLSLHPALYNEREVVRFYNKKNVNYQTSWSRPTEAGDSETRTGRRTFTEPCGRGVYAVPCKATEKSWPPSA
jgi:hypothetical protein